MYACMHVYYILKNIWYIYMLDMLGFGVLRLTTDARRSMALAPEGTTIIRNYDSHVVR